MKRSSKPAVDPAKPLTLNSYQMSDILESGLLSPERIAEIEAAMAADTSAVYDANGKLEVNAKIITKGGKRVLILDGADQDYARDYHHRNHFAEFLTQSEIATLNYKTFEARHARRDAEQFEKAEKVDGEDWSGWVFDGETYHSSVHDWLEHWYDIYEPGSNLPTHIWAAEPEAVVRDLSVDDVLLNDIEARGWEEMDSDSFAGTAELQAALDAFVAANREVVSYHENPKKAILVDTLCLTHLNWLETPSQVVT